MTQTSYKTDSGKIYNGHIEVKHNWNQQVIHFDTHPAGPHFFPNVMGEIVERRLGKPTAPEITSLIYHAYTHQDEAYSDLILDSIRQGHVYADTGILVINWGQHRGALIQDHPPVDGKGGVVMDPKLMFSVDNKTIRWAPAGYKIGHLTSKDIETHSLIGAVCRPEGAEKIAKIIRDHKGDKAYIGEVPDLQDKKKKSAENSARVASFMAKKKDLFWLVSEYADAHADIFGFSYPIIKREGAKSH